MEETNKSTAAADCDDTDQKLPAEPKRSSKGSARQKSERSAKRKARRSGSGSSVPGAQALNMAGERRPREKSYSNTKRRARASRSTPTTPGGYSATRSSQGYNSKNRKDRRGDKASGSRPLRPERDEKEGKPAVPGAHFVPPSAARRKQDRLSVREPSSARPSAVNEEEKCEDIPVEPVAVAHAVAVNEEVGTENQEEKARERR
jgi:hypothetical protein